MKTKTAAPITTKTCEACGALFAARKGDTDCQTCIEAVSKNAVPVNPLTFIYGALEAGAELNGLTSAECNSLNNKMFKAIGELRNHHAELVEALEKLHYVLEKIAVIDWTGNSDLALAKRNAYEVLCRNLAKDAEKSIGSPHYAE